MAISNNVRQYTISCKWNETTKQIRLDIFHLPNWKWRMPIFIEKFTNFHLLFFLLFSPLLPALRHSIRFRIQYDMNNTVMFCDVLCANGFFHHMNRVALQMNQVLQFNDTCNKYGFRFGDILSYNSRFGSKWQCTVFYTTIVQRWNFRIGANCIIDSSRQRDTENGTKVCIDETFIEKKVHTKKGVRESQCQQKRKIAKIIKI